jgi:4-hydroxybenzoate polyprenyltransferase
MIRRFPHLLTKRLFSERILLKLPRKLQPYASLIRFDKPVGTILTLWPGIWGLTLGVSSEMSIAPSLQLVGLFGLGAFCVRSAGCIVNDLWDQKYDAKVKRTASRPLASGALSSRQAMRALVVMLCGGAACLIPLNPLTQTIAACSVVPIMVYPLFKRFTSAAQLFLGLTFNVGAIMGVASSSGMVTPASFMLYLGCVSWTVG